MDFTFFWDDHLSGKQKVRTCLANPLDRKVPQATFAIFHFAFQRALGAVWLHPQLGHGKTSVVRGVLVGAPCGYCDAGLPGFVPVL